MLRLLRVLLACHEVVTGSCSHLDLWELKALERVWVSGLGFRFSPSNANLGVFRNLKASSANPSIPDNYTL